VQRSHCARSVREDVAKRIAALRSQYPRFEPQLAIIQAGSRPDSSVYVRMKAKAAEEVGIKFKHVTLPADAALEDVVNAVNALNGDESISGILVQLPLGSHISASQERTVTEAVSPEKDVDGSVSTPPLKSVC
jgi:methylenetetrahydrofolate dehydrogenase (NADP+) / methenyltetrahydrofolate cyclohydrolase / formyltetrahydrofolate synthetase